MSSTHTSNAAPAGTRKLTPQRCRRFQVAEPPPPTTALNGTLYSNQPGAGAVIWNEKWLSQLLPIALATHWPPRSVGTVSDVGKSTETGVLLFIQNVTPP